MVIWILDYQGGKVLSIEPIKKTKEEIEFVYNGDVDKWFSDNEDYLEELLGIRITDCHWMVTNDDSAKVVRSIYL